MADNNFFFKVLAELSDTEYFTFYFFPLTGGGAVRPLVENFTIFFYFFFKPYLTCINIFHYISYLPILAIVVRCTNATLFTLLLYFPLKIALLIHVYGIHMFWIL